ncbi:MAG: orotate phosphoribosyltransferase [Bdellovibrionota bacterium]
MNRQELCKNIFETAYLTGNFKLRSGQTSHEYFDKYRFEAKPELLKAIAQQMKSLIPAGTEILAGLELGGVPLATALAIETGLPLCFVRKKAKEYGTEKVAEGTELKGKKVCVIEDVVTTGGQVILSAKDLRDLGANVDSVLCVILRDQTGSDKLKESGLELKPLFTMEELKATKN